MRLQECTHRFRNRNWGVRDAGHPIEPGAITSLSAVTGQLAWPLLN